MSGRNFFSRLWFSAAVLSVLLASLDATAAGLPRSADLRYEVRWGLATVEATQQWRLTGGHYQLSTELKLPFPFAHRRYLSQGQWSAQHGLLPERYEEFQVGDPVPRHQAIFDVNAHQLFFGEPPSLKKSFPLDSRLPAQAQDLNALPFQLGWLDVQAVGRSMLVTNGKGAVQHRFEQQPALPWTWQGQALSTVRLVSHASDGDLEVWLAPALANLPVVVIRRQDGKSLRFEAREISFTP